MNSVILRTLVPILLLVAAGFCSRKWGLLKKGDQRVLSAYIYYFALPALLLVNMADIRITMDTLKFILSAILPPFVILSILLIVFLVFRFSVQTLYLLIVCSVFGSHSFFGLPFVMFAFDTPESERLGVLSSSFIAIVCVSLTITVLEMYKLKDSDIIQGFKIVVKKLSTNPLILSIVMGLLFSILRIRIPLPLARPLHMLGSSAATVAIFQLGVSLYGRSYKNLKTAFYLSLIRVVVLPFIAIASVAVFHLGKLEGSILILMHATPMALATIVLSERYKFYQDVIPSLMLISSLVAPINMNIWLLILGYK